MSRRLLIVAIVAMVCVLALGGLALAQSGKEPAAAAVRLTAVSGGHYQLDAGPWQIRGSAAGLGYHLEMLTVPAGSGTPCCCVHLPCILRATP